MADPLRLDRVLVPLDGSEFSRFAAEYAVRLAMGRDAEVVFLHVVDPAVVAALLRPGTAAAHDVRTRLQDSATVCLQEAGRLAAEAGLRHREVIEEGDPAEVILEMAARIGADLVVMGRIGRRGPRRMLVGSITQRVIESADRAVLVVTGPPARS